MYMYMYLTLMMTAWAGRFILQTRVAVHTSTLMSCQ